MPDAITPVGAMVQPPNALGTLSSILGIQQQQQNLQTGAFRQQEVQAESQQAQQANTEKQALARYTANAVNDPSYWNADGSANVQKFQRGAMAVAPVYGPAYIGQMTTNFNGAVENRRALLSLSNEQRATVGNYFGAVASKPGATQQDFLDAAKLARGVSNDPGYQDAIYRALIMAPKVDEMPTDQASLAIRQHARLIASATGAPNTAQSNIPAASMVQTRAGLTPTNVNPQAPVPMGPVGPTMENAPAPQIVIFPNQQLGYMGGGAGGMGAGGGGGSGWNRFNTSNNSQRPRTAMDDAPPANAPRQIQEQFATSADVAQKEVLRAREADGQYGTNMSIAQTIRHLAGDVNTGPGTQAWNRGMGILSSQAGGSEAVSNYQTLSAFLDRQSALLRQQMGLPETNAGQSQAQLISGNTEYQRGAILAKNNLNEALTEGAHLYRQGLDRVEGFTGNASPRAVQEFKAAWAANFDPTAQEYRLALKRGDTQTANQIVAQLSPQQRNELARKGRAIDALSQGQMPQ